MPNLLSCLLLLVFCFLFSKLTNRNAFDGAFMCLPAVIFTSYTDYPFSDPLDWKSFSIILDVEDDVNRLNDALKGIRKANFTVMQNNLRKVKVSNTLLYAKQHVLYLIEIKHVKSGPEALPMELTSTQIRCIQHGHVRSQCGCPFLTSISSRNSLYTTKKRLTLVSQNLGGIKCCILTKCISKIKTLLLSH
jgi:hypothetical protein